MALRTGLAAGVPLSTRVRLVCCEHPPTAPAQPGTTDSTKPETLVLLGGEDVEMHFEDVSVAVNLP
jgi:hypothetical protein